MQAMVRTADRVVVQVGTNLGEIRDPQGALVPTQIVNLTAQLEADLRAALATPGRGDVHLAVDGTITIDAPRPPTPDEQAIIDAVNADLAICRQFYQAPNGTPTAVQRDAAIKAFMRVVRRELTQ